MKKMMSLCLALLLSAGICTASAATAEKGKKSVTTTVFMTDVECQQCAKKIMNNVSSLGKGIEDVKVDVATKEVTVIYDASKNSNDNIIKGFASLKVKASVKGNGQGAQKGECQCGKHEKGACDGSCSEHKKGACKGECGEYKDKKSNEGCCDKEKNCSEQKGSKKSCCSK